jgi:hypothetical protein
MACLKGSGGKQESGVKQQGSAKAGGFGPFNTSAKPAASVSRFPVPGRLDGFGFNKQAAHQTLKLREGHRSSLVAKYRKHKVVRLAYVAGLCPERLKHPAADAVTGNGRLVHLAADHHGRPESAAPLVANKFQT